MNGNGLSKVGPIIGFSSCGSNYIPPNRLKYSLDLKSENRTITLFGLKAAAIFAMPYDNLETKKSFSSLKPTILFCNARDSSGSLQRIPTAMVREAIEISGLREFAEDEKACSHADFEMFHLMCAYNLIDSFKSKALKNIY